MAFVAHVAGRTLRLEAARGPDGALVVQVREGEASRSQRLDLEQRGGWVLARLEGGRSVEAFVERRDGRVRVWLDGAVYDLDLEDERQRRRSRGAGAGAAGPQTLKAPMPGKIVRHLVAVGDQVEVGQGVIVVEAMKMENELRTPAAGVVKVLPAAEGSAVEAGAVLVVLE